MRYYYGIDLHARSSQICVIDEDLNIMVQQKVANDLSKILDLLTPYQHDVRIVVESTFNWDWLIDGLQAASFTVCLAHSYGLTMITGAKVKTDRRDALALAKLLKAGMIPKAYIYPEQTRPIRDLIRRRQDLVQLRAGEYGALRRLLLRHGILDHTTRSVKTADDADLKAWFDQPLTQLYGKQQHERIALYSPARK